MMDVKSLAKLVCKVIYHLLSFTTMAVGIEPDLLPDGGWEVKRAMSLRLISRPVLCFMPYNPSEFSLFIVVAGVRYWVVLCSIRKQTY